MASLLEDELELVFYKSVAWL